MRLFRLLALSGLLLGLSTSGLLADSFTSVVSFGDSLSDTGNVFTATQGQVPPAPPYANGEWSNGSIWLERLTSQLGLPTPVPVLAGGSNYAFGYAETGSGQIDTPVPGLSVPNLGAQIGLYFSSGSVIGPETLFVLWCGANDFFDGQTDPSVPVANVAAGITQLALAGGQSFLVVNLPLIGETPALKNTPFEDDFNILCSAYNTLLSATEDDLEATLGIQILRLDVAALLQQVVDDPGSFGLSNVTDPALDPNTGAVVANPDEYLFWDPV
ncbi:MAG TPA: SGNH/GDSL hydrolase family protein, partial [Gemmataceae bacterium]|nr:SGNH/GDSL hydrolase family protein [Gemmataceae bacterium]